MIVADGWYPLPCGALVEVRGSRVCGLSTGSQPRRLAVLLQELERFAGHRVWIPDLSRDVEVAPARLEVDVFVLDHRERLAAASDVVELAQVLNEVAREGLADTLDIDIGQLRWFGGDAPDAEFNAASWDGTHVLVTIAGEWYLLPRDLSVGLGRVDDVLSRIRSIMCAPESQRYQIHEAQVWLECFESNDGSLVQFEHATGRFVRLALTGSG